MKKYAPFAILAVLLLSVLGTWYLFKPAQTQQPATDELPPMPDMSTLNLPEAYTNTALGFSMLVPGYASSTSPQPNRYTIDESYIYQLAPGKEIKGVKFTIPENTKIGTNLSSDSYVSVERLEPATSSSTCSASLFLDGIHPVVTQTEGEQTYSVASSSNAGAGNRYEETVYTFSGSKPCIAVRYFIHYTVLQNYPEGTVKEFDREALISEFDQIRQTVRLIQK